MRNYDTSRTVSNTESILSYPSDDLSLGQFEHSKEILRELPIGLIAGGLSTRLIERLGELVTVMNNPRSSSYEYKVAVVRFGVIALGRHALRVSEHAKSDGPLPEWIDETRDTLQGYATMLGKEGDGLLRTPYFVRTDEQERRLERIICSSMSPEGWYDDRAFAAAVAIGWADSRL